MKNHLFSIGLLVALAISCSIHEVDQRDSFPPSDQVFYAQMEEPASDGQTKVFVDEDLMVLWHADDRVSIFNKYTYNQEYRFTGKTGANSGSFKKVSNDDFITGNALDLVYAVYPYHESTEISNKGVLSIDLPATQIYAENSFGIGANTMVSCSEGNELMFKNLCGYMMLKLYGDDVTVTSISLKGNNGEPLAGAATVNASVDSTPTLTFGSVATKEISLTFDTPVKLGTTAENATTFWIVVPPTVFSKGFSLTVKDNKNGIFEKSTSKSFEISRNKLARMSALEVVLEPSDNAIVFSDENVKAKLVAAFDTNGDSELSYKEAAAVISGDDLKNAFGSIKTYKSFDEFQYFTSIQRIPIAMFMDWNLLSSIVVPEGVSTIEAYAFRGCSKLTAINIPDSVETIGNAAFLGCTNLTTITIPEGVKSIKNSTFSGCTNLSYVSVPSSITSFEENAFLDCESLCSITIPEGVSSLSKSLFSGCSSLSTIAIPETVSEIWDYAFYNCSSLASVTIPHGVWVLRKFVFAGCTSLSNVNLPESVTYFDNGVFYNCSNLKSIDLSRISYLGGSAFYGCSSLTSIVISESVSKIYDGTFKDCTSLSSVVIPESITSIGNSAFCGCTSLSEIIIPESVSSIGENAFSNCGTLTKISIANSNPPLGGLNMFLDTNNCPILVPYQSVDAYKTAQYWSDYADRILPLPEAVDLGLSVKWASFNLGASKPEEYGDYYAWGEIEPYYEPGYAQSDSPVWKKGKEDGYYLQSYKWAKGTSETLTKYCTNSSFGYNGYTDGKTLLDPEDDAAQSNLGGNWRMPTDEELKELLNKCTWKRTSMNGIDGRLVTGPNGNSIFFPTAGYWYSTVLYDIGSTGIYWSSSLHYGTPINAYHITIGTSDVGALGNYPRISGFSIRPVYAE